MVSRLRKPLLALGIAIYLSCLVVSPAIAGMVGTITSQGASSELRQDEISRIQAALETKIVTEKLKAYGLTPERSSKSSRASPTGRSTCLPRPRTNCWQRRCAGRRHRHPGHRPSGDPDPETLGQDGCGQIEN